MSKIRQLSAIDASRSLVNPLLFAALPAKTQARLCDSGAVRRFASGALIQQKGDDAAGFWLIEEGAVAVGQFLAHGEFRGMGLLGPGDSYGELAVLAGRRRVADAVARGPVLLRWIPASALELALAEDPASMRALLRGLAAQLQETLDMIAGIRRGTAAARTASLLANLAGRSSAARRVRITQQEIADLLGLSRATANAALRVVERAGLIRRAYGAIEVLDARALRSAPFD